MTLYQKMLVFYAIMASICALITWFLSKDHETYSPVERIPGGFHLADELSCCPVDLSFLKHASRIGIQP